MAQLNLNSSLDVKDNYECDKDSIFEAELLEIFPQRYFPQNNTKIIKNQNNKHSCIKVCCNSTEQRVAVADKKGDIHVLDSSTGKINFTCNVHTSDITDIKFSDDNLIYSSSLDMTVKCYDVRSQKEVYSYKHAHDGNGIPFTCLDVSSNGGEYVCAGSPLIKGEDAFILFWDVRNGNKELGAYSESHSDDITSVKFHPNIRRNLCSGAMDNIINFYDISKPDESEAFTQCINFETTPDAIFWDPLPSSSSKLFVVNFPQLIQYWDVEGTAPVSVIDAKKYCKSIKRSIPEQCHFISLSYDSDHNPIIIGSSNLNIDGQTNACVRAVTYDRDSKKLKPHSTLELKAGSSHAHICDSIYLSRQDAFVTLSPFEVTFWKLSDSKRKSEKRSEEQSSKKSRK